MNAWVVLLDGSRHILKKRRFTGLRRGYDHASLSFSDWGKQVDNTHRGRASDRLQTKSFVREHGRELVETFSAYGQLGRLAVDFCDV